MKGHKEYHHRKHRETGGVNEAEEDLREKPEARTNARHIDEEAEERKRGGHVGHHRVKRRHGGEVHHSSCKCEKCHGGMAKKHGGEAKKHVGRVHGEHGAHHAGHKPRKAGGRTGSNEHPFSSAREGTPAKGRKEEMEFE